MTSRRRRQRRNRTIVRWTLALMAMFTMLMANIALAMFINHYH